MDGPENKPLGDIALAMVMIGLGGMVFFASFNLPEPALEPIGPAAFPFAISLFLIGLSLVVLWRALSRTAQANDPPAHRKRLDLAILTVALTVAYLISMEFGWLTYRWATIIFVFVLTMLLFDWQLKKLPVAIVIGLITGVGLKFAFTEVLYLDLP